LAKRELDMVIAISRGPADRFVVRRIMRVGFIIAAAPTHPLALNRRVTLDDLARHRFTGGLTLRLSPENRPAYYGGLNVAFDHLYTAGDIDALIPLAIEGQTTILLPAPRAQPHIEAGDLVALDLGTFRPVSYFAMTTLATSASPIVNTLIREAQAVGRELLGGGEES
ncbi:MAG: substrate-binding domain-containing protein, partial [Caulobacteraceae bacterium]|nr:substrate-binding domain-containing protein [Caulobacteraceae bacterium]